jgi:hypothetical protein
VSDVMSDGNGCVFGGTLKDASCLTWVDEFVSEAIVLEVSGDHFFYDFPRRV